MTLFIAHDYLVGQQDITSAGSEVVTASCHLSEDAKTHTQCVEHQVFHAPALGAVEPPARLDGDAARLEFRHIDLLSQLHPFDFQTPPRYL